eukprot:424427-Pyramimonas_sp.AAC.1
MTQVETVNRNRTLFTVGLADLADLIWGKAGQGGDQPNRAHRGPTPLPPPRLKALPFVRQKGSGVRHNLPVRRNGDRGNPRGG